MGLYVVRIVSVEKVHEVLGMGMPPVLSVCRRVKLKDSVTETHIERLK